MRKKALVLLAGLGLSWNVYAQGPVQQPAQQETFKEAMELFDGSRFQAARNRFESYLDHYPDGNYQAEASYYAALSALRSEHQDGEHLMDAFVRAYPKHPKAKLAFFELGTYYFENGKYHDAIRFYKKVNERQLTKAQQFEYQFQFGYAYFARKMFSDALKYFNPVKRTDNPYTYAAAYYAGYIAYGNEEYDRALLDLEKAGQHESYADVVPYMIANVYYKQKDFSALLSYGDELFERNTDPQNSHLIHMLMGEAAFAMEDFTKAAQHYQEYVSARGVKPAAETQYKAGFALYKAGNNAEAIDNLLGAANSKDTVSQYASYYLGVLYLEQNNAPYAATAFEKASRQTYSSALQEDAAFHLAKVHYASGNTSEALESLSSFIETYPKSKYAQEAGELLSEAYLHTTNYKKAVDHIESLPNKSYTVRKAYQKVTYLYGTQLFNQGKFYHAVQMFDKSLANPIDKELVVLANFWSAEAYSVGKKYEEAINSYASVFRNSSAEDIHYLKSRYGIAYAYYNSNQYDKALTHFKYYVEQLEKSPSRLFYEDALLRLGDCYYANKGYHNAIAYYDKAIEEGNPEKDYAYFQKGMVFGIQGELPQAKRHFELVLKNHKDSRFIDDALFQRAQFDFVNTNYAIAANEFTHLIEQKPESPFVPYAILKRAISSTNLQKHEQSVKDYKRLLDEYISHDVADAAILGLQEALAAVGRNEEIDQYLTRYQAANPENEAVAGITYESAKSLYYAQKYDGAIEKFSGFIASYPKNSKSFEAKYFIADAYYRQGKSSEALRYFQEVVDDKQSVYVNRALLRIGDLYMAQANYGSAINTFKKLEGVAGNKKEQYNAWAGQMKAYFQVSNYDSADFYAKQVLQRGNVSVNATNEAQLYLGKSAYKQGDYDKAIDEFLTTLNTAKDIHGAEAQYLMADIFFQRGLYQQSIEALFDLNANFSVYTNWLGKSFLLIADNYIALGEYFQAKATLNSVIEKSTIDQVVNEAKQKLKKIEKLEQEEATRKAQEAKQATDSLQYEEFEPGTAPADSL